MSGALQVSLAGDVRFTKRLGWLTNESLDQLLDVMGAEVENQTRRRISNEKTAPDGTPWAAWSPKYALTRHGGQSLLESHGNLVDSIQRETVTEGESIGSPLVYGAIQQFGGAAVGIPIPARPFIGLSAENERDLGATIDAFFERRLAL